MVRVSGWGHFGISLGLHGIIEGHFGIRLRIILGYILDHSGIIWFQVVIILGLHGYDFGAMLCVFHDYFDIMLESVWDSFGIISGIMLGLLWDQFGLLKVTLGSGWEHFRIPLGSFWHQFGINLNYL